MPEWHIKLFHLYERPIINKLTYREKKYISGFIGQSGMRDWRLMSMG